MESMVLALRVAFLEMARLVVLERLALCLRPGDLGSVSAAVLLGVRRPKLAVEQWLVLPSLVSLE